MKDFQDQTINQIQMKLNELIEENNKLRSKMLTEVDVKMIVAKAIDARMQSGADANDDFNRRRSQSSNEPISLQIKSGRNRFANGLNAAKNKPSTRDSTDSENKKDATFEL